MAKFGAFEQAARAHAASRAAEGTRSLYEADLSRWLVHCELEAVDPTAPTLASATAFRDALAAKLASQTVRRILSGLSSMYDAVMASEQPLATWNPFKKLPRPPADAYTKTEAISEEDAEKIIDAASESARDSAIVLLLYETGIRRKSVSLMERAKIFKRSGKQMARVIVKGNKEREIEIPERAATALDAWLAQSDASYVFPAVRGDGPLTPSAINKMMERRVKEAGIRGRVHPHQFRAAWATTAFDSGMPLRDVQAAMHHSDPNTTVRYDRGARGTKVASAVADFRKKKK